jgi:hypothetical protein
MAADYCSKQILKCRLYVHSCRSQSEIGVNKKIFFATIHVDVRDNNVGSFFGKS